MGSLLFEIALGAAVGYVISLALHHRAGLLAKRQNTELRDELRRLRAALYGSTDDASVATSQATPLSEDELRAFLVEKQDWHGHIQRPHIYTRYVTMGFSRHEVDDMLTKIAEQGDILVRHDRVEVR